VDVTRSDDGTVTVGFDTEEFLAITPSFGWLCRGLNRLRGARSLSISEQRRKKWTPWRIAFAQRDREPET
jgi:hypothetical protein